MIKITIQKILTFAFNYPLRFFVIYFLLFTFLYGLGTLLNTSFSETEIVSNTSPYILIGGVIAGLLQLLGYILYLRDPDIDPNPVTWFMFAYGTTILTVLEWDAYATVPELILPTVCAVLAVVVSLKCWLRARKLNPSRWWPEDWWPEDKWERWSFMSDIVITIGYVSVWILVTTTLLPEAHMHVAVLAFLFLSNLSTFPSFYPLLRETYLHPHKEHWAPWTVWTIAYTILGVVTYQVNGNLLHPLMFYPISNAAMHGMVAYLSLKKHVL